MLPELDGSSVEVRGNQASTISAVLEVLAQRAATLERAAQDVLAMAPPTETTYTPISSADAVIKYARNFVPSWAGAIAIDLLPAVLVFILAITQGAIREGREGSAIEETLTLAELRAAVLAMRDMDAAMKGTSVDEDAHDDADAEASACESVMNISLCANANRQSPSPFLCWLFVVCTCHCQI